MPHDAPLIGMFDRSVGVVPAFIEVIGPPFRIFPLRQPRAAFLRQQLGTGIDRFEHHPIHISSLDKTVALSLIAFLSIKLESIILGYSVKMLLCGYYSKCSS